MNRRTLTFAILGLAILALTAVGCRYLMSGTFIIVQEVEFSFTADHGFYWYPVDMSDNEDWDEYSDNIDDIEMIGFSFVITNNSDQDCELNAWFAAASGVADPTSGGPSEIPASAVKVIDGLSVSAHGSRTVTYGESLDYISNLDDFIAIVQTGRFDYFGTSCGGTGDDLFDVTEGLLVITLSGSSD